MLQAETYAAMSQRALVKFQKYILQAGLSHAAWHAQVLRFIDVGGHEKYLKTALYGMTSLLPDYMLLCVSARSTGGILPRAAREHLAVALALEIPLAVVLTQVCRIFKMGGNRFLRVSCI
jgi:GTPase